jgi:hypothetical protein
MGWREGGRGDGGHKNSGKHPFNQPFPNSPILSPSQPYLVLRDTLRSCDAYGMRPKYTENINGDEAGMEIHRSSTFTTPTDCNGGVSGKPNAGK